MLRAKPEPDLFLACSERIGVPPEECYVVGDAVWDLLAARRARMLSVGLLSGGYGDDELNTGRRLSRLPRCGGAPTLPRRARPPPLGGSRQSAGLRAPSVCPQQLGKLGRVATPASPALSASQLARLGGLGEERTRSVGDVLYRVGDRTYPFIAILEGEVEIVDAAGHEIIRHGPSGFLGEMNLLTDRPCS